MSTRRKFLFDCSTALAALAWAPMSVFSGPAGRMENFPSLDQISYPQLASQVNTRFRVRLSSGRAIELKLLKAPRARPTPCVPGRRPPGDAGNEKFSLVFSGPKDELLEPAIHRFEHERLGRFEMYVGQVGTRDTQRVRYEAVFNRPPPDGAKFAALT